MVRVLIAAPTPALRAGLRSLLAADDLQLIGEMTTLAGWATELAAADVVVVGDAELLADAARVIDSDARLAMLVLADDDRPVAALRGLPLVGWGIAPRDVSPDELQAMLHAVAQGLVVLPVAQAERLIGGRAPVLAAAAEQLTPREQEVLELISQGLPNKLIARQLQISEHTVKFHISSIFTKLGASSRTDAINRGARQGLITL